MGFLIGFILGTLVGTTLMIIVASKKEDNND